MFSALFDQSFNTVSFENMAKERFDSVKPRIKAALQRLVTHHPIRQESSPLCKLGTISCESQSKPSHLTVWKMSIPSCLQLSPNELKGEGAMFWVMEDCQPTTACQTSHCSAKQLSKSDEIVRFNQLIDMSLLGVVQINAHWECIYANSTWEELSGYSYHSLHKAEWISAIHPEDRQLFLEFVQEVVGKHQPFQYEVRLQTPLGKTEWVMIHSKPQYSLNGVFEGMILLFLKTDSQYRSESRLIELATRDELTGLLNRYSIQEKIKDEVRLSCSHRNFTLFYLDLDGFKAINDAFGHAVGDELLQLLAKRLTGILRAGDYVARLGGDEFALLIRHVADKNQLDVMADKVLKAVNQPFMLNEGEQSYVSASIGIHSVEYEDIPDGMDNDDLAEYVGSLMVSADAAMYQAKHDGRNTYRFYRPQMDRKAKNKIHISNALHKAVAHKDFVLHYQPQIDIATDTVYGVEALLRWPNNHERYANPAKFVPLLEQKGLMRDLGYWIINQSIQDHKRLLSSWQHGSLPSLSINISAAQFKDPQFTDYIETALLRYNLSPELIILELTETLLMEDDAKTCQQFEAFKRLGVKVALDDFGTGYSSFSYLHRFPIDIIKIDRSFIADIDNHATAQIVYAILTLGEALGKSVIAEGIEKEAQVDALKSHGCNLMQGWLFSKALSLQEVIGIGQHGYDTEIKHHRHTTRYLNQAVAV